VADTRITVETPGFDALDHYHHHGLHRHHSIASSNSLSLAPPSNDPTTPMADYKSAKEAFHADNPGSSVHYINLVSLTAFVSYPILPLEADSRRDMRCTRRRHGAPRAACSTTLPSSSPSSCR
jgi:hypothetical protein